MKRFRLQINLDDESEVEHLLNLYGHLNPAEMARALGFKGKGSKSAANALRKYARHKRLAINFRLSGDVQSALDHEQMFNVIYKMEIQPAIDCW